MNWKTVNKSRKTKGRLLLGGAAGGLSIAAWRLYRNRPRKRIPSHEALDDPAVTAAFNRVATWPQMRLLRLLVVRRATARIRSGLALDLGCGPGHLVVELATAAPDLGVTGLDLSAELLAKAEARARAHGVGERVSFRRGDAALIPYPDASLDLVVSTLSLHHWQDPPAVFDEVARVLRPDGAFVIFDLRRDLPLPAYLLLWFATRVVVPAPLRRIDEPLASRHAAYTPAELSELAARSRLSGWQVEGGPLWLFLTSRNRREGTPAPAALPGLPEDDPNRNRFQRLVVRLAGTRPVLWLLRHTLHLLDALLWRLSGGRLTASQLLAGTPTIFVTTTGARSGLPRTVPLVGTSDGERILLVASNWGGEGNPAWYYNLRANPECQVRLGDQSHTYVARELTGAERERAWQRAVAVYPGYSVYRQLAPRRTIPVFALEPARRS
jgi:deazaflavin-dependent oxidoreductase (nitroreductase family)